MVSNIQGGLYCHANATIILLNLKVRWCFINPAPQRGERRLPLHRDLLLQASQSRSAAPARRFCGCSEGAWLDAMRKAAGGW